MSGYFHAQPLNRFNGGRTTIKRPKEIAYFSYDENHEYKSDESGINYYYPPRLPVDLCEGFDKFRHYEETEDTHLDSLLRAIMEKENGDGSPLELGIVSWRGMLTKIMTTPFDWLADWSMNVTRYDDAIYIEEDYNYRLYQKEKDAKRPQPRGAMPHEMMTYWGYKFETLALIPDIWDRVSRDDIEARPSKVVDNHAQYCSVVQTQIGSSTLVLGGEVDGVWDNKPKDPSKPINWIELKTTEEIQDEKGLVKFERKLLRFWAQSFLLGVPKVIVGWRTKNGILTRIEELETQKLPGMVRRGKQTWDGNTCINFTAVFLEYLRTTVTEGGIWRMSKQSKNHDIRLEKIEQQGYGNILTEEYVQHRKAIHAKA